MGLQRRHGVHVSVHVSRMSKRPPSQSSQSRALRAGREVAKAVRSRKACSVIMAPNIEQDEDEGRLDGLLAGLLGQAASYGIPVVYALSRKKLGLVRPYALTLFPKAGLLGRLPLTASRSCTRCRARR